ncbi:MAG: EscJ/YscJ/HrcJ family type III secretion inner membrane ring protein, partial [Myxococcota bacterium]
MRLWGSLLAVVGCLMGCTVDLRRGLDERQANDALLALSQAGIDAEKVADAAGGRDAFTLRVPREEVPAALAALQANDLPRAPDRGLAETFGAPALIPTPTEERARLMGAIAAEVARTLRTVDRVVDARAEDGLAPR